MVDSPEIGIPYLYKGLITWAFFWAFLDAFTIGANDIANAFANAVGAKTISFRTAVLIACVCELVGVIALGSTVTDAVRNKMVKVDWFKHDPYVLALGMSCVNLGSGGWVFVATTLSMPVSTTHSVVGAILGIGVASWGASGVNWGYDGGFGGIVASWFISPVLSGVLSAIFYLSTKFLVLKHPDEVAVRRGIFLLPVYFFFAFGVVAGFMTMKGIPAMKNTPYEISVPVTIGIAVFFGIVGYIFCVPWTRRAIVDNENLPWYTMLYIFAIPVGSRGYLQEDKVQDQNKVDMVETGNLSQNMPQPSMYFNQAPMMQMPGQAPMMVQGSYFGKEENDVEPQDSTITSALKWIFPGFYMDVGALREEDAAMHAKAFQAYSKTEEMFKILQLTTCCFFSIAHGANDVANAIAPFATVWMVYSTGAVSSKAEVPIWLLVYGGLAIDIGLLSMRYYIMDALGNHLTLQSPSRGFCIELGAMFTVMTFSRLGVPVSTTHCISGATTAVGLCNGDVGAVNWKLVGIIFGGWILTCPCAGIVTGLLYWAVAGAPSPVAGNGFFNAYHG